VETGMAIDKTAKPTKTKTSAIPLLSLLFSILIIFLEKF
jgi:hypothetical protein